MWLHDHSVHPSKHMVPWTEQVVNKNGKVKTMNKFVKDSIFVTQIRPWFKAFPSSQILVLNMHDMISNPEQFFLQIETFLGLEHAITSTHLFINNETGLLCSDNYCPNSKSKGRPHPPIPNKVFQKLKLYFEPYNKELYKLIGKNFHWYK